MTDLSSAVTLVWAGNNVLPIHAPAIFSRNLGGNPKKFCSAFNLTCLLLLAWAPHGSPVRVTSVTPSPEQCDRRAILELNNTEPLLLDLIVQHAEHLSPGVAKGCSFLDFMDLGTSSCTLHDRVWFLHNAHSVCKGWHPSRTSWIFLTCPRNSRNFTHPVPSFSFCFTAHRSGQFLCWYRFLWEHWPKAAPKSR